MNVARLKNRMMFVRQIMALLTTGAVVTGSSMAFGALMDIPPVFRGRLNSVQAEWDLTGFGPVGATRSPVTFTSVLSDYPLDATTPLATVIGDTPYAMDFELPNFVDPLIEKLLRIQVNFYTDLATMPLPRITSLTATDPAGIVTMYPVTPINLDNIEPIPGGASNDFHGFLDFVLRPNPDNETIRIRFPDGTDPIDATFDTWSIPEPGSLVLAGSALVGVLLLSWPTTKGTRL